MRLLSTLALLSLLTATQVQAGCLSPEDNYGSPTPCGGNPSVLHNPYYTPLEINRSAGGVDAIETEAESKVDEKKDEHVSPQQNTIRVNPRIEQQLDQRR